MNIKYRQTCRICGNRNFREVIDLGYQYFQGSFRNNSGLLPSRKTPNLVVRCDTSKDENACGLIQTKHTVPPRILYTNYWYESGISDTMKKHLSSIVTECLSITKKQNGNVVDIASNDNTLLRNYPDGFMKVGVDPSNIAAKQNDKDITVINDLFPTDGLDYLKGKVDIITSIACFYDIDNPKEFANSVQELLRNDGVWVIEVAYWPSMLQNIAYDSIVNEHIIHYHLAPLEILFSLCGLKIFDARKTNANGGSILIFACKSKYIKFDSIESRKRLADIRMEEFNLALDEESTYDIFRSKVMASKEELVSLLKSLVASDKTIHIYGASTKLNTILEYCGIGIDLIQFAAERSLSKVGGKTMSGIKIIYESESLKMKPDYYLVGPYHFKEEILKRNAENRKNGIKFIFPLPKVEIV